MAKQAQQELGFMCYNCGKETTVIVDVSRPLSSAQGKGVTKAYYCQYCNHANKIEVPYNLGGSTLILGRDRGFLRYTSDGIPLLQGEKGL
jgi:hypothetical protein